MNLLKQLLLCCMAIGIVSNTATAQKKPAKVAGAEMTYMSNGEKMYGYVAYDENQVGKRPAIVIIPEWWGNTEYTKMRARMFAELGYIAIAADMYGNRKIATNPKQAQEYATPFYKDPQLGKERIEAAMAKIKEYPQTDPAKLAAVGYCFGGSMVLNAAKLGSDLKAVVSFHGGLATVPASKGVVKAKILVCNGAADKFVSKEDIASFKKNLDTAHVPYKFIDYKGATHAFTNREATENGKKFNMPIEYNEPADTKSWNDMKAFLKVAFK